MQEAKLTSAEMKEVMGNDHYYFLHSKRSFASIMKRKEDKRGRVLSASTRGRYINKVTMKEIEQDIETGNKQCVVKGIY